MFGVYKRNKGVGDIYNIWEIYIQYTQHSFIYYIMKLRFLIGFTCELKAFVRYNHITCNKENCFKPYILHCLSVSHQYHLIQKQMYIHCLYKS